MVERREPVALTVFREWTTCIFRLIPARFALVFALGCLFWAVEAPTGFALDSLGGVLAAVIVLPMLLALIRRRQRRRQQAAVTATASQPAIEAAAEVGSERYEIVLKARFGTPDAPNISRGGSSRRLHSCSREHSGTPARSSRRLPRSNGR
jgi:hypothetical protein